MYISLILKRDIKNVVLEHTCNHGDNEVQNQSILVVIYQRDEKKKKKSKRLKNFNGLKYLHYNFNSTTYLPVTLNKILNIERPIFLILQ